MSSECTHQCDTCSSDCGEKKADLRIAPHPLSHIQRVIGIASGKGGVGKSLVTSLLAVEMQRRGYQAAILDADVTGPSIPRAFGLRERATGDGEALFPVQTKTGIQVMSVNLLLADETDPVVWRGPVISSTVSQFWTSVIWKDVDFLFVDLPPGTGDVPLTVFQSLPLNGLIVVTSPQELVSMIVSKAVKMANMLHLPMLGLVENFSYLRCPDCGRTIYPFGESRVEKTATAFSLPLLARLPIDPKLAAAADAGTIELFDGDFLGAAAAVLEGLLS